MEEQLYKVVAEFIKENILGCKFVGITNDGEVLVSFDHDDDDLIRAASKSLKDKFSKIKEITVVEKVDLKLAKEMIDDLNNLFEEEPKKPLLDIGKF